MGRPSNPDLLPKFLLQLILEVGDPVIVAVGLLQDEVVVTFGKPFACQFDVLLLLWYVCAEERVAVPTQAA